MIMNTSTCFSFIILFWLKNKDIPMSGNQTWKPITKSNRKHHLIHLSLFKLEKLQYEHFNLLWIISFICYSRPRSRKRRKRFVERVPRVRRHLHPENETDRNLENDLEEKDPDLGEKVEDQNLERNPEVKDLEVKGLDQGLVRGRNPRRIEKERRKGSRPKKNWYYFDAILSYNELF